LDSKVIILIIISEPNWTQLLLSFVSLVILISSEVLRRVKPCVLGFYLRLKETADIVEGRLFTI